MAREMVEVFVDDIDGKPAEGTTTFAHLGVRYEIDLSKANAARLDRVLAPFVKAARRVGGHGPDQGIPVAPQAAPTPNGPWLDEGERDRCQDWILATTGSRRQGKIPLIVREAFRAHEAELRASEQRTTGLVHTTSTNGVPAAIM